MIESFMSEDVTCYLWEETDPQLTTTCFQRVVESDKLTFKKSCTLILRGAWSFQDDSLTGTKNGTGLSGYWASGQHSFKSEWKWGIGPWWQGTRVHVQKLISTTLINWMVTEHYWTSVLQSCLVSWYLYAKGSWKILGAVRWVYSWSSPCLKGEFDSD